MLQKKLIIIAVVAIVSIGLTIAIKISSPLQNKEIEITQDKLVTEVKPMTQMPYTKESFIKPSEAKLRAILTPLQYQVTQEEGTERPYANEYDKNTASGLYVDIVSGEPLFSSSDKYDSGTGWPSFVKPISVNTVTEKESGGVFGVRVEIRSRIADSHLGHVFDDGPQDRGGKRYCMNSAAMKFIPKADMDKLGYGEYIQFIE